MRAASWAHIPGANVDKSCRFEGMQLVNGLDLTAFLSPRRNAGTVRMYWKNKRVAI